MVNGLLIIAITAPDDVPDEAVQICRILDSGEADLVHVRKPGWTYERTRSLIEKIPPRLRSRIKVHDHFRLSAELGLGGVHLNGRNPVPIAGAESVSKSLHDIGQLDCAGLYDYVTLSPIFDSISKKGYMSAFNLADLKGKLTGRKVIALGGVTPDKLTAIKDAGFYGAAMLGHFWQQEKTKGNKTI